MLGLTWLRTRRQDARRLANALRGIAALAGKQLVSDAGSFRSQDVTRLWFRDLHSFPTPRLSFSIIDSVRASDSRPGVLLKAGSARWSRPYETAALWPKSSLRPIQTLFDNTLNRLKNQILSRQDQSVLSSLTTLHLLTALASLYLPRYASTSWHVNISPLLSTAVEILLAQFSFVLVVT